MYIYIYAYLSVLAYVDFVKQLAQLLALLGFFRARGQDSRQLASRRGGPVAEGGQQLERVRAVWGHGVVCGMEEGTKEREQAQGLRTGICIKV